MYLDLRKAVLESEGYNVIGVTNAADALEAIRDAPVCCILADHMLKGQTGIELAEQMKDVAKEFGGKPAAPRRQSRSRPTRGKTES